ncbi:unnamed protein product [Ixodes pacificus]
MGWSQGTTVTQAPRPIRQRSWLFFMPQSITVIRGCPPRLYTSGFCRTEFRRSLPPSRRLEKSEARRRKRQSVTSTFPSMVPFSRIFFVSSRKTKRTRNDSPVMPGTPADWSQLESDCLALQWLYSSTHSPTTSPAAQMRRDSKWRGRPCRSVSSEGTP